MVVGWVLDLCNAEHVATANVWRRRLDRVHAWRRRDSTSKTLHGIFAIEGLVARWPPPAPDAVLDVRYPLRNKRKVPLLAQQGSQTGETAMEKRKQFL